MSIDYLNEVKSLQYIQNHSVNIGLPGCESQFAVVYAPLDKRVCVCSDLMKHCKKKTTTHLVGKRGRMGCNTTPPEKKQIPAQNSIQSTLLLYKPLELFVCARVV